MVFCIRLKALENNLFTILIHELTLRKFTFQSHLHIGYIKEGNDSESKVNNQEKSVATSTKQQKVDYSVTPNLW